MRIHHKASKIHHTSTKIEYIAIEWSVFLHFLVISELGISDFDFLSVSFDFFAWNHIVSHRYPEIIPKILGCLAQKLSWNDELLKDDAKRARNVEIFPSMWRRKRGWILLICLSIEGVPETSEGHPVLANRKAGLSSRKQQLKHSWRGYKKWKLLPLLFDLAFMNCQFRWEISFQQITRQRLDQS